MFSFEPISLPGNSRPTLPVLLILVTTLHGIHFTSLGLGISRDGHEAGSQAMAGNDVAASDSIIASMAANPAGLPHHPGWQSQANLSYVSLSTSFSNNANTSTSSKQDSAAIPDFGIAYAPEDSRWTFGLALSPDVALGAKYIMTDPPGGADGVTSYGRREHRSLFVGLRTSVGASYQVNDWISAGFSIGALYNRNELESPYIFQGAPGLQGFKTLLDLKTEGWGVTGQIGLLIKPTDKIQLGFGFNPGTSVQTDGRTTGNASAQLTSLGGAFASVQPDFAYDTDIEIDFPMTATAGGSIQLTDKWKLISQVEWIQLSDAFDQLRIHLSRGNNADLNGFLGTSSFVETSPLNWKDQWVFRVGTDYKLTSHWSVRAGYAYGNNPVPDNLLTPLSGPIMEQILAAGVFYSVNQFDIGLAAQYILPNKTHINSSDLLSGEYDNSRFEVEGFVIGGSITWRF